MDGPFTWAQLIGAIAECLPPDAEVYFAMPSGVHLRAYLAKHGRPVGKDFTLPNDARLLEGLVATLAEFPREPVCVHLFVNRGSESQLQAWDVDVAIDTFYLSAAVGSQAVQRVRSAVGRGPTGTRDL